MDWTGEYLMQRRLTKICVEPTFLTLAPFYRLVNAMQEQ
jgi:hypothetical protein